MLENRPNVYNYSNAQQYLRASFEAKRRQNSLFSLRSWAQQMGLKGHSSLVFFMRGQRKIRPKHIPTLLKGLRLSEAEEKFWSALVHLESAESEEEKNYFLNQLALLHPARTYNILDIEKFRLIADWLHMAILEMTKLKDFKSDIHWIQKRLAFPVDEHYIQEALTRLMNLHLLKMENGQYVKTNERLTTPNDRPSECIREHHKQVLQNGLLAIDQQDVNERVVNSCAMTIDISKMPEAKELILKFRQDMAKLMEKPEGDETYQLSVQFFKLTGAHATQSKETPV
jgi:uncharacterized protein (TIGR02147 family)